MVKKTVLFIKITLTASFALLCIMPPTILNRGSYRANGLSTFSSYEELVDFLGHRKYYGFYEYGGSYMRPEQFDLTQTKASVPDYSETNIQVEGVDEADIMKTDGEYLYLISKQHLFVVKAYPPEEARITFKVAVNGTPSNLFVNGGKLILFSEIGNYWPPDTLITIYSILDKYAVFVEETVVVEGEYYSSRMVGNYVYTIVRKDASVKDGGANLPSIYTKTKCYMVEATEVYYLDELDYIYYFTTVTTFNVENCKETLVYKTFLTGYMTAIYVSAQNIYLTTSYSNPTSIYRIHYEEGEIEEAVKGEVNGRVLNQFSMDEYEGYFRIATTTQKRMLENNLYVLDMDMKVVGRIEGIAPRETIHSARFMGELCYLVTFEKVDPFFVIDLSNPCYPRILGELKVTGYSDYLHLYDEKHIIGIGKETVEAQQGSFSWYQGIKISLFNVENLNYPKELAKYVIGHRGTDSPILTDHKAFLFSKERNLLVIPVMVAEINPNKYPYEVPPYVHGEPVWQGAYVFNVSIASAEKIMLRGKITHVPNGNVYDYTYHVTRALYIGDVLYTISENMIKMHSLADLAQINEVSLYL